MFYVGLLKNVYHEKGNTLYIKGLDPKISEMMLHQIFEQFGLMSSIKIACDTNGTSMGYGTITFLQLANAERAAAEMNGKIILEKPIMINFAQKKHDR